MVNPKRSSSQRSRNPSNINSPTQHYSETEESAQPYFEQRDHLMVHKEKYLKHKEVYYQEDCLNHSGKWDYDTIVKDLI